MRIGYVYPFEFHPNQMANGKKHQRLSLLKLGLWVACMLLVKSINAQTDSLKEWEAFGKNPGNLRMFSFNESEDSAKRKKRPLVIVLHGCTQQADAVARIAGWNKLAQLHGFVVVYPQQRFINNPSNCFNWFNKNDIERGKGECQSIANMLDYAVQNLQVDSERVYITGVSAGAGLALAMGAAYPEKFKGVATIAGPPYHIATGLSGAFSLMRGKLKLESNDWLSATKTQHPDWVAAYPQLVCFQGEQDPIVHPSNLQLIVRQWCTLQQIDSIPDQFQIAYQGIAPITRTVFLNAAGEEKIITYSIKDMGHKIPVHPGEKPDEGGTDEFFTIDIGFHSTYEIARIFNLL